MAQVAGTELDVDVSSRASCDGNCGDTDIQKRSFRLGRENAVFTSAFAMPMTGGSESCRGLQRQSISGQRIVKASCLLAVDCMAGYLGVATVIQWPKSQPE